MYLLVVTTFSLIFWSTGLGDVHNDDEKNGCNEPSCLLSETASMRRLIAEQAQALLMLQQKHMADINQQQQIIKEQNTVIGELQVKISKLEDLQGQEESSIHQLQQAIAGLQQQQNETDKLIAEDVNDLNVNETLFRPIRSVQGTAVDVVLRLLNSQMVTALADIVAMKVKDRTFEDNFATQNQNIQDGRTSTFVRWGSSSCPGNSDTAYSGVVGGAPLYNYAGGGSNYLCLSMSPSFGSSPSGYQAYLYGTQYENNKNALCATCRTNYATTIMIPGTSNCPGGWTEQYNGYLMAQHYNYYSSEFICVDSYLGGRSVSYNSGGSYLYFTKFECGTLPCPPYVDNEVVRCVVCSR